LATIDTDDILQQLNGLELLDTLILIHQGSFYLENSKTLNKLSSILTKDDISNAMLAPKIISFFGDLATKGDLGIELFDKNQLLPIFKTILEEGPAETKAAVITSIGKIGSTSQGLLFLSKSPLNILKDYIYFVNVEGDLRIQFLHSVAFILTNSKDSSSSSILKKLIENVENRSRRIETMTTIVMPLLRHPFVEQRYAVLDVLSGLTWHSWGVDQLMKYPGFFEYISNRNSEETKTGKEWQFMIIQNIVRMFDQHPQLFEQEKSEELKRYLKQGLYYVRAESSLEVATKGA